MTGLSRFEQWIFDRLTRQRLEVLVVLPLVVFVAVLILGVLLATVILGRTWWPPNFFDEWLVVAAIFAGTALYLASFMTTAAFWVRTQRFRLLELYRTTWDIRQMSWREFEDLIAACYQLAGYDVLPRGGYQADGGVDVEIRKEGKTWLVQCKHRQDTWVDVRALREFLGVVASREAAGGIFVTAGIFDEAATEFARRSPQLKLVDGEALMALVQTVLGTVDRPVRCPKCGGTMIVKDGKRGRFLSCRRPYSECDGSLDLPRPSTPAGSHPEPSPKH